MIHLNAKELRFTNAAIASMRDAAASDLWSSWYHDKAERPKPSSGRYAIPEQMIPMAIRAVCAERGRLMALVQDADDPDPDVVNDAEVYANIEAELQHAEEALPHF